MRGSRFSAVVVVALVGFSANRLVESLRVGQCPEVSRFADVVVAEVFAVGEGVLHEVGLVINDN